MNVPNIKKLIKDVEQNIEENKGIISITNKESADNLGVSRDSAHPGSVLEGVWVVCGFVHPHRVRTFWNWENGKEQKAPMYTTK